MTIDPARLLAEAHAARLLARAALTGPKSAQISVHDVWAHVRRLPGAPVSLALERAIRSDTVLAARYRMMLASLSVAHAPFAIAASDGAITQRRVGVCAFQIIEHVDAPALLVIRLNGGAVPTMLEITLVDDRLRIALPDPAEGAIILSLDPNHAEAVELQRMVQDPASEIFLF